MTSDADFVTAPKNAHLFLFGGKEFSSGQFFCILAHSSDDPGMSYVEWWYEIIPLFQASLLGASSDGVTTYTIQTPEEWNAFVGILLTYLNLHDGNKVTLHQMGPVRKSFEVHARLSESEIRDLLITGFGAPSFNLGLSAENEYRNREQPGRTAHLWCFMPQSSGGSGKILITLLRDEEENGWRYEIIPLLRESLLGTKPYREALGEPAGPAVADYWWLYAVFGSGGWAAFATVLRAYINRHKRNKVIIYLGPDEKALELEGRDYSVEEIKALLHERVETELLLRERARRESTERGRSPTVPPGPDQRQLSGQAEGTDEVAPGGGP